MSKRILRAAFAMVLMAGSLFASSSTMIIKVNGPFGIINKGANQGVQEGQIFEVKREGRGGLVEICKVRVIRITANRAAIEQLGRTDGVLIQQEDQLFDDNLYSDAAQGIEIARVPEAKKRGPASAPSSDVGESSFEPITEPTHNTITSDDGDVYRPPTKSSSAAVDRFRRPWLGVDVGGMFPGGQMSASYSASPKIGLSYMVTASPTLNLGVELNHSALSGSAFSANNVFSGDASSMLEALFVMQKFFGNYFFVEGGGGVFRPKIQVTSIDGIDNTFSSTHLGFVGGGGVLVRTSPYAGFVMKGRLSNYFGDTSQHYFGLSGGFRFKIR